MRGADKNTTIIEAGPKLAARLLLLNAAGAVVENISFVGMHRSGSWGLEGSSIQNKAGTLRNCIIRDGNTTQGGMCFVAVNGANAYLIGCEIRNYKITSSSYVLRVMNKATVDSCLIHGNTLNTASKSDVYRAVYVQSNSKLLNSTITANNAENIFYAASIEGSTMKNTIIWNNQSYVSGSSVMTSGNCTLANNCESDPLFVDEAGGDYRLAFGSSCIDAAVSEDVTIAENDVAGNDRIIGNAQDIGAYEFVPSTDLSVAIMADTRSVWSEEVISFSSFVANGENATYLWDFGDGDTSDAANPTHAYENPGYYNVSLTVTDGGNTATKSIEKYIYVKPRQIYVSSNATGAVFPYATRETAAASIEDALSAASDGAEVILLRGTYEIVAAVGTSYQIPVSKAITIRSEDNDPTGTIIRHKNYGSNNTPHRFFNVSHADAVVSGISFTHGSVGSQTDGGVLKMSAGTVTNCHIYGNTGTYCTWNLQAVGVNMTGGKVVDCVISNNTAADTLNTGTDSGGLGIFMTGGTALNCLIAENTSSSSGTAAAPGGAVRVKGGNLVNCTIANNTIKDCAGVYATGGKVINCVIAGNTALDISTEKNSQNVWAGTASCFENCAVDKNIVINESCPTSLLMGFVDLANRDYHLTGTSVAVDAGKETALVGGLDLDGMPRISGDAIDAGCYEYDKSSAVFGVQLNANHLGGFAPQMVILTAATEGASGEVSYAWDFDGDGIVDEETTSDTCEANYATPGRYRPTVTATCAGETISATLTEDFSVYPKVLYVKSENNDNAFPYNTPETAATNIQDALNFSIDGSEIIVLPGTHIINFAMPTTMEQFYRISDSVSVHGLDGERDRTILKANKKTVSGNNNHTISFFLLDNPNAKVYNLTMEDGFSNSGTISALSTISSNGGMISNCVMRSGTDGAYAAHAGLKIHAGLVTHSIISNCIVQCHTRDSAGAVCLRGGRIENSLIANNSCRQESSTAYVLAAGITAENAGEIRSCTVVGNRGPQNGGVYLDGTATMINSIVAGNTAISPELAPQGSGAIRGKSNQATYCMVDDFPENEEPGEGMVVKTLDEIKFKNFARRDYSLKANSPAINAGIILEDAIPSVDLLGKNRIFGYGLDLGAFELQRGRGTIFSLR